MAIANSCKPENERIKMTDSEMEIFRWQRDVLAMAFGWITASSHEIGKEEILDQINGCKESSDDQLAEIMKASKEKE